VFAPRRLLRLETSRLSDVLQRPCRVAQCYAWPIMARLQRPAIFKGGTSHPRSFFVPFAGIFATPFRDIQELLVERG
jgi:hypothetical protein